MTDHEAVQFLDDWIKMDGPAYAARLGASDPDEVAQTIASRIFVRLGQFATRVDAMKYARLSAANEVADAGRRRGRQRTGHLADPLSVADPGSSEWEQQQELEEMAAKGRHAERFLRDVIAAHPGEPSRVVAAWLDEGLDERNTAIHLLADDGIHHPSDKQVYRMERHVSRNKSRFFRNYVEPRVKAGRVPVRLLAPLAALVCGGAGKAAAAELVDRVMTRRGVLKWFGQGLLDTAWRMEGQRQLKKALEFVELNTGDFVVPGRKFRLRLPSGGVRDQVVAVAGRRCGTHSVVGYEPIKDDYPATGQIKFVFEPMRWVWRPGYTADTPVIDIEPIVG